MCLGESSHGVMSSGAMLCGCVEIRTCMKISLYVGARELKGRLLRWMTLALCHR